MVESEPSKGAKRNFKEIYKCRSSHPECRGISIVSPFIERPDGSHFRVCWAPCGLDYAREYIRHRAANPEIADLLSNDGMAEAQPERERHAQPVAPERVHMAGARGTAEMESDPESSDDDMLHDIADSDDSHGGENIRMGPVPSPFPEDDMVYDLPGPPQKAHMPGRSKKGKTVHDPFGRPVPAPGQGGMMYDDPDDPYGGQFSSGQGMPYRYEGDYYMEEGMDYPGESSRVGHAASGASGDNSGGSWAGSTIAPASRPPRARYVQNRHENLYHGDEFEESELVDPPGVAVAREERRPQRTATDYTTTSQSYNTVQYSRDYRYS